MNHTAEILRAYSKDPIGKGVMSDPTIFMKQKNTVCGDELTVFLRISKSPLAPLYQEGEEEVKDIYIIEDRSRDGYTEMQTTAAASMLAETIIGVDLQTILTWTYTYIKELGLELSPRRRRSGVTALLATRNAIHSYIGDGVIEEFEDLL